MDCGAGIGRVTKNLLINHFESVDLLEQNPKFIETAKTYLSTCISRVDFHCSGNILMINIYKIVTIHALYIFL